MLNGKETTIRSRLIVTYTQNGVLHFEPIGDGGEIPMAECRVRELRSVGIRDARIRYDGPCVADCGTILRNASDAICFECIDSLI